MKFLNEGEDSDRVASSVVMHNDPKQKKRKNPSGAVCFTDTDPFTVPNFLEGIDRRKFGSVASDIEALCARVYQRRKSYLAMNHTSPFMFKDVEKNKGKEHSKLVNWPFNQPAHQIVIDLDDEDPVNDVKAIAPPIVISDSENEDGGDQMPYCQHKKDRDSAEIKAPREEVRSLDGEIDIGIDEEMNVSIKNDMVIDEQNYQIGTEDGGECDNTFVQKDLMDRGFIETKSPQEKVRSPPGKIDTRIDKGVHLGTTNDVVVEKSKRSDAENREKRDHSFVQKDPIDMDSAETKTPREELGSRAGEIDIRIDKKVYTGSENGEEGHPSFFQKFQKDLMVRDCVKSKGQRVEEAKQVRDCIKRNSQRVEEVKPSGEMDRKRDKGLYVGAEDDIGNHQLDTEDEGLDVDDIWKEMTLVSECSKDNSVDPASIEHAKEVGEDCDHNYVLKDDLGYVCRVCGVIERGIETIFEFQYKKVKRTRTCMNDSVNAEGKETTQIFKFSQNDLMVTEISAHPRHMKQMKPHQVEGFNFLCRNLVAENPGGCILAHAPGSGKTFMVISFMQSFLARFPRAKPLVVLPKGILATWKREFRTWQVEDISLLDFYSLKADNRAQQLEVLKQWVEQRSILFLGYKQFSSVVCDTGTSKTSASCQEILLKAPTILILDEGHTPRNENTDVLQSLAKVQTPRKVVLSGTLYQNHVKEVFNILNLVRPKFLKLETSRAVVRRILSRVHIPGVRKHFKAGVATAFYDLVEHALQKDEDFKRKVTVIQDLRELTIKVLHYYKGDFLDELPGLIDYTVVLNLSCKQKNEVQKLKKLAMKFKISSVGSAIYLHPKLNSFSENCTRDDKMDEMMDEMLENLDMRDGVKARFFLNMLKLCESAGEKLLVFCQYLLPLKFLERLTTKRKSWSLGREIFVISGESSSEHREWSMERFNNSPDAKVFFGSIKACGEGISLVGASRVIILDVHLNPSVTRQAIGRAFRPGQKKKVYTYRLVAADSPEEEDHSTCFKKELISKMWFEWNEYNGYQNFAVQTVDVQGCGDMFLEETPLGEDVKVLYRR